MPPGRIGPLQQGLIILFQRSAPTPDQYMAAWQLTRGPSYHIGELYGNSALALLSLLWAGGVAQAWSLAVATVWTITWAVYMGLYVARFRMWRLQLRSLAALIAALLIPLVVFLPIPPFATRVFGEPLRELLGVLCGDGLILFSVGALVIEADYRDRWRALRNSVR